jgi:hypothetical protein
MQTGAPTAASTIGNCHAVLRYWSLERYMYNGNSWFHLNHHMMLCTACLQKQVVMLLPTRRLENAKGCCQVSHCLLKTIHEV